MKPLPAALCGIALMSSLKAQEDPYLWLEDVAGDRALTWVRERNVESERELAGSPAFHKLENDLLAIMDSKDKIPYVAKHGRYFYNFWRDAQHVRGIWRRTSLEEYRKPRPQWETVLDIDELGRAENESWVFHGAQFLYPGYRRCLISLSRGGSDAGVVREFDVATRSFVPDGFKLPQAKSTVSWIDQDTVFVATDFGQGSLTSSGYPRIAKLWTRGTPLEKARTVFEVGETDVACGAYHDDTPGFERDILVRSPSFFTSEKFLLNNDGSRRKIEVPDDAESSVYREWLLVAPRTAWTVNGKTYAAGSLVVARLDEFMGGKREFSVIFEPTATTSLSGYNWTRHYLILDLLDDVKNRLELITPGAWKRAPLAGAPTIGTVSAWGVDSKESDDYFMNVEDFLTPSTLSYGTVGRLPDRLKAEPAFFDASNLEVSQHFTKSRDGTRIPYFQVSPKGMALDGSHPTLLSGYGGFEVSQVPYYSGVIGRAWLGGGGVYILANIRGGGEYGPAWHLAAVKQNRPRCYEDFAAVAQDLIARRVTASAHLGIEGGSNGGLLVGNMLVRYPQLFGAVLCENPLLDMKRFSHLLAGASWIEEYGDPDKPEEWRFIQAFSPYHNLKPGVKYPPTFFTTTTRDDRVHPGHARKMMARMQELGCDVRLFENTEGGHGSGADNKQAAHAITMGFEFLCQRLK